MDRIQKIYVVAFISDKNRLLIAKRNLKSSFLPGYFELPGGKIEFGEDPKEALKRELMEELNAEIEVGNPYHAFSFVFKEGQVHGVEIAFFAKIKNPKSIICKEHEEIKWVTKEELDNYKISEQEKQTMITGFEKQA